MIGTQAEALAASVNINPAAGNLPPSITEIERGTISWIAKWGERRLKDVAK
jgi:hypothetical protein